MLGLFLVFLFAFILLSLITHIYYSFLFLHPTLKLTCGPEIEEFLTHLAVKRQVSASTQNQAFNTVVPPSSILWAKSLVNARPFGPSSEGICPWSCHRQRSNGFWTPWMA